MKRILVIGGCGDMVTVAVKAFLNYDRDVHLTIFDFSEERLAEKKREYGDRARTDFVQGDLFDVPKVSGLMAKADLVMNAAGPYYKTAAPIIKLCIQNRVSLCDINDEPDASVEVINMGNQAEDAGIGVYIGLGASPGLTNIWAKELLEKLDRPEQIDTVWCTGDEGKIPYGRAVIAHAIGIFGGHRHALSYRNGRVTEIPSFVLPESFRFAPPLGEFTLYEVAHPEPLTISHFFPELKTVRNLGGLHPQAQNGFFRGLSQAVCRGDLSEDETIDFVQDIMSGKLGALKCWRFAVKGMREQIKNRHMSRGQFWDFIWKGLRGKSFDYRAGLLVSAVGQKNGKKVKLTRMTSGSGKDSFFNSMATATGLPFAALSRMVLDGELPEQHKTGVFSPEAWVDTETFYRYMARYGVSKPDLMLPIKTDVLG